MATPDDRGLFQRILSMGEQRLNRLAEELLSNPRFAEVMGKALQTAMETKGRVDRNMQSVLSLLNLPSKADYRKLSTKVEALQGSLVNLNIKLDRILAERQKPRKERATKSSKAQPAPGEHKSAAG